jgi:UDP-2,3-diacylglucosamine pyrophosphatase LpxH
MTRTPLRTWYGAEKTVAFMADGTLPAVVASDVHLVHGGSDRSAGRLARLLQRHPGHELVLAGDIFNLSLDAASRDPGESAASMLARHTELVASLKSQLSSGYPVTLISGNHDAGIVQRGARERLLSVIGVSEQAPLHVEPWFIRRGGVHIEHGHVYDPDNAPAHPLAAWSPETEPLGIALTRRFLSPHDAFTFAHAHHTTPLQGLLHAFKTFKGRAPLMVLHYFATSSRLAAESAVPERMRAEKARGAGELSGFAARSGLSETTLRELLDALPRPTHEDFEQTFHRLYFDRVLATVGIASGAARLLLGGPLTGAALALSGAVYLRRSTRDGVDRYSSMPVKRLYAGAELVRRVTGAKLVIFGHTHCEDEAEGYKNSASFAYTYRQGSPYLVLSPDGAAERQEIS